MPNAALVIAVVVIAVVVIAAILVLAASSASTRRRNQMQQRTENLRERFGPEYDRTVAVKGDARSAEDELTARLKRVAHFDIRPLAADEGRGFTDEWQIVQAGFVDDPSAAVNDADALVARVMAARGYPESDFEQRSGDVSVNHPAVLAHYRAANEIALRHAQGEANTEDLRQAVLNYRALFVELLDEPVAVEVRPDTEVPDTEVPDTEVPDTEVMVAAR